MLKVTLQADTDILDAISEQARKSPKLMDTATKRMLRRKRGVFLKRLQEEPPPPKHPLRVTSARQRRKIFAIRREMGLRDGDPFPRSHRYSQGFDIELDATNGNGVLILTNDDPAARYIGGDDQQPFNIDTGWKPIAQEAVKMEDELSDALIEVWYTVAL